MIVVAVEYLNTLPFIYGITHAAPLLCEGLTRATPSQCATKAEQGLADIALVPVAALPSLKGATIITDYCISATGRVETVALLSNDPLPNITTIYLDSHSRTSVELIRILTRELWHIDVKFVEQWPSTIEASEAIVAIGDKVFDMERRFTIKTDLSQQWQQLTSLPFVFAVWVALTPQGLKASHNLNAALKYGVQNIEKAVVDDADRPRNIEYLTQNIEFDLSDIKRQAMQLFLSKIQSR